jgi:hypothetical protein
MILTGFIGVVEKFKSSVPSRLLVVIKEINVAFFDDASVYVT